MDGWNGTYIRAMGAEGYKEATKNRVFLQENDKWIDTEDGKSEAVFAWHHREYAGIHSTVGQKRGDFRGMPLTNCLLAYTAGTHVTPRR